MNSGQFCASELFGNYLDVYSPAVIFRMDFVEADMAHAQTPFYVVQNLITTLLQLEGCNSVSEREAKILDYIKDEDLKSELCLLNDLLGTHVRG